MLFGRDPVGATLQLEAQRCVDERHGGFDVGLSVREAPDPRGRVGKGGQRSVWILPANGIGRRVAIVARQADDPFIE